MSDIKQFKLTSGEELVCEVVEWADDNYSDLVVRRCFTLNIVFDGRETKYYTFRSFMALQEGKEVFITINCNNILSEANPNEILIKHYKEAVKRSEIEDDSEDSLESLKNEYSDSSDTIIKFRPKPVIH
jgi:hypothetical protein